jgi:hypothetical protein
LLDVGFPDVVPASPSFESLVALEVNPVPREGSSNCPAGVRSKPPSGLNVNLLKKFVKLSSPYNRTFANEGGAIAGKGGMGEGDRPTRLLYEVIAGDPGACELLNEDRREDGARSRSCETGGGGNIVFAPAAAVVAKEGVLATLAAGVGGAAA